MVAVAVYVPSVYPDPLPVTVSARISPNALVAVELLLLTTFCLTLNFPASKLPLNNAVPVLVVIDTTFDVPSVILKSLSVPPLNTKSPPPLVSKFKGTSTSVPSVNIVVLLLIVKPAAAVPRVNLGVVESTLKNGSVEPRVECT